MMSPVVVIVMGVSGSGKSTVGRLLAEFLQWEFQDADRFHPDANVEKMRNGIALTDEDRGPWLRAIADWIDETRRAGRCGVIACSALKRRYRDLLIRNCPDVRLVYLKGDAALIAPRIVARHGHYMPANLLPSQFEALEEPGPDECPITISIDAPPGEVAARIAAVLNAGEGS
jgi:gluconokinase